MNNVAGTVLPVNRERKCIGHDLKKKIKMCFRDWRLTKSQDHPLIVAYSVTWKHRYDFIRHGIKSLFYWDVHVSNLKAV